MNKELNNFTHCSKLDLIKMYKKSRRDMRRLSRQKVDLEKENAKLKSDFRICEKNADTYYDQLTKAKEIIKNLLILKKDHHGNTDIVWRVEVTEQAEQFIKDMEK